MGMTVINDLHLGVLRSAGTTPASALKLRQDNLARFDKLLKECKDYNVLINGDLFDTFSIPLQDLWEAIEITQRYLSNSKESRLYAARGNHDLSRNGTLMSSFDLYCKVLSGMFPDRFVAITQPTYIAEERAYVIPHLLNQDLHDAAMLKVPECSFLFLHANYDNFHTLGSDHSVNVTKLQCQASLATVIVFGHEHSHREELAGKVLVTGCQLPTAVADWVTDKTKYLLRTAVAVAPGASQFVPQVEFVPVLQASNDFSRQDWRMLKDDGCRFIRVEGEATAAEAADMVSAISKFRARSEALVITNAVKVDGVDAEAELELSVEEMGVFDVKAAVMELLLPEERAAINKLLEASNE